MILHHAIDKRGSSSSSVLFEGEGNKQELLPLHRAVTFGHVKVVKILLAAGADVNNRCSNGYSALLQVCVTCDMTRYVCRMTALWQLPL